MEIPAKLKQPLLEFLKRYHSISSETIFPDIPGAVSYWNTKQSMSFLNRQGLQKCREERYVEAEEIFDKCLTIDLNPGFLTNRGIVRYNLEKWNDACSDYSKAIQIIESEGRWTGHNALGLAYFLRGITMMRFKQWEGALSDLASARENKQDVVACFGQIHQSLDDYERVTEQRLPDSIREILTGEGKTE